MPAPFPPTKSDPRPFGVDVSRYNGWIDWNKMRAYDYVPIDYCFIRSGQGGIGSFDDLDSQFYYNWQNAGAVGIPRMAYHVLYPTVTVDDHIANIARIFAAVGLGDGPLWIDFELFQGQEDKVILDRCEFLQIAIETNFGIRCGVYSGWWFLEQLTPYPGWWELVDWWIANYTNPEVGHEHPGPPAIGVLPPNKVMFHQTSSWIDGNPMGAPQGGWGEGAGRIDGNRFQMGGKKELYEYLGLDYEEPEPEPDTELAFRVCDLEDDVSDLYNITDGLVKAIDYLRNIP